MIRLVTLNNPRVAQSFIDYMLTRDIEIRMMPEGQGQFVLWLLNDAEQLEAEAELKRFLENPLAARYSAASWDVAEQRKDAPLRYYGPGFLQMIKAKAGPFTLTLMVVCIGIYLLQMLGYQRDIFALLHFPAQAEQKWQLWRWITHALLHFSVLHIVFNLLWWWQLGGDIEKKLGSSKLIQIFVISAALSGAGQYWIQGANFGGLSGVVYALLGYLWIISVIRPQLGLTLPKPIIIFMLVWLAIGFIQPFMAIANTAHLVGLCSGVLFAVLDAQRYRKS